MRQCALFGESLQGSSFSRMSPDCIQAIEGTTSLQSSVKWAKGGIVRRSRGEYWTVSSSESPKDAVVCSLQQVVILDAPSKYWLSPKAAAGILGRAERRGKALDPFLRQGLIAVAGTSSASQADRLPGLQAPVSTSPTR